MNCEIARELMLEADLSDLSGTGQPELARHLRDCPACRARAERIVTDSRALAAAVEAMRPAVEVAEAGKRAVAMAGAIQARRRVWRRASLVTPLALAAGIGALLFLGDGNGRPVQPSTEPVAGVAAPALDIEAPAGASVAVFRTDNPNIVVIWYF